MEGRRGEAGQRQLAEGVAEVESFAAVSSSESSELLLQLLQAEQLQDLSHGELSRFVNIINRTFGRIRTIFFGRLYVL